MHQISIIRNEQVTNQASFSTREELDAWLELHQSQNTFGQNEIPEIKETRSVLVKESELIKEAVIDEETREEIEPAEYSDPVYEDQEFVIQEYVPAEYEVVIEDITATTEAHSQLAEAKAYLASTDYMAIREFEGGEPMPEAVKLERAAKRLLINSLEAEFGL